MSLSVRSMQCMVLFQSLTAASILLSAICLYNVVSWIMIRVNDVLQLKCSWQGSYKVWYTQSIVAYVFKPSFTV